MIDANDLKPCHLLRMHFKLLNIYIIYICVGDRNFLKTKYLVADSNDKQQASAN